MAEEPQEVADKAPDWDAMREDLIRENTANQLREIAAAEGAGAGRCPKADCAAAIVANRRRVYLGKKRPWDPWRAGYGKVEAGWETPVASYRKPA